MTFATEMDFATRLHDLEDNFALVIKNNKYGM